MKSNRCLSIPVAAYLPCNAGPITFSINSGAPIVVAEPHHPISVVLNKLAELSFYRWQEKPADDGKAQKRDAVQGNRDECHSRRLIPCPIRDLLTTSKPTHVWPIPPPNFNRPVAPVPGAIPRPGGVPGASPRRRGGIPPRPGVPAPATQALPTVARLRLRPCTR